MALAQPERNPTVNGNPPPTPLRAAGTDPGSSGALWFVMCSWCERIRVRGRWLPLERALALIDATHRREHRLTHGICPSCFAEVSARAERDRRLGAQAGEA